MNSIVKGAAASVLICAMGQGVASPVAFDFRVQWQSGEISAGSFSYDSSSVAGGTVELRNVALSELSFDVAGHHYDASNALAGTLQFDGGGALTYAAIGNNCGEFGCTVGVDGRFEWWVGFYAQPPEWDPTQRGFAAAGFGTFDNYWSDTGVVYAGGPISPAVPEPATLWLLAAGLGAVAGMVHRRKTLKSE